MNTNDNEDVTNIFKKQYYNDFQEKNYVQIYHDFIGNYSAHWQEGGHKMKKNSIANVIRDEDIGIKDIATFYNDASSSLIVPEPLTITELTAISDSISVLPDAVAEVLQFVANCMDQYRMAT